MDLRNVKSLSQTSTQDFLSPNRPSNTKSLGYNSNPDLTTWYEDATSFNNWYQAVLRGEIELQAGESLPSQQEYNDFLYQMQWAEGELGYQSSTWGEDPYSSSAYDAPSVPDGASNGAVGNYVYTAEDNEITLDGSDPTPVDVWGNLTLNVPPPCTVTAEVTTDTRFQPPEEVLKYVVTNPSLRDAYGNTQQTVVFVHDYQGGAYSVNADIKSDGSSRFTDYTGGLVTGGEYVDPAEAEAEAAEALAEASIEGELSSDGTYTVYDGTTVGTIDFTPVGSGTEGEVTINDVQGDSTITVHNTDTVTVQKMAKSSEWDYEVTVKHEDGSSDVYRLHSEYHCTINAVPEHITFLKSDGTEYKNETPEVSEDNPDQIEMPGAFTEDFTIQAYESVSHSDAKEAAAEQDISYPSFVSDLAEEMGLSEDELLAALEEDYGLKLKDEDDDGKISKDEVEEALDDANFPPVLPDEKFINFLKDNDGDLKELIETAKNAEDVTTYMLAMQQATAHTVTLLQVAYPGSTIEVAHSSPKFWWQCNDITFDGQEMEAFQGGEGGAGIGKVESSLDLLKLGWNDLNEDEIKEYNEQLFGQSDSDTRGQVNSDPFNAGDY